MSRTVTITDTRMGSRGPEVKIPLPITASANRWQTYITAIPCAAFTALGIFALTGLPVAFFAQPFPQNLVAVVALLIVVVFGGSLASIFVTAMRDLNLPQPLVIIDEDGIFDRRVLDRPIRWTEIASITSHRKIRGGLLLELHDPLPIKFNWFRIGTIFHFWSPPPQAAYISMNWLLGPFFPADAVFAFAMQNNIPIFERRRLGGVAPKYIPGASTL